MKTYADVSAYYDNGSGAYSQNITSRSNAFKRQAAFPLEVYSIFPDFDTAKLYAMGGHSGDRSDMNFIGLPYEGQIIAVKNNNIQEIYVLDTTAQYGLRKIDANSAIYRSETIVKYNDESISTFNIVGALSAGSIENITAATDVNLGNPISSISANTFLQCNNLSNITIPDSVTSIGSSAFNGCSSLMNVTIPDSVTSIGIAAFGRCSKLTSIVIPNSVTSIGNAVFLSCSGLTSVTIPDAVTSIALYTFNGCSSLMNVTIPDSVTNIGNWAFNNCSSLTSITIPESVSVIGNDVFNQCVNLQTILVKGKTQDEAESLLSQSSYPNTCKIVTYAKSDWVEDNFSKTFIGEQNTTTITSNISDLSVIKISKEDYEQQVADAAASGIDLSNNVLYVVSSDYIDAYEQRIENVVMSDDDIPSEAVNAHYVKSLSTTFYSEINNLTDRLSTEGVLVKNQLSFGYDNVNRKIKFQIYDISGNQFSSDIDTRDFADDYVVSCARIEKINSNNFLVIYWNNDVDDPSQLSTAIPLSSISQTYKGGTGISVSTDPTDDDNGGLSYKIAVTDYVTTSSQLCEASSTINTRIDNLLSSSEILNLSVHNLTADNISSYNVSLTNISSQNLLADKFALSIGSVISNYVEQSNISVLTVEDKLIVEKDCYFENSTTIHIGESNTLCTLLSNNFTPLSNAISSKIYTGTELCGNYTDLSAIKISKEDYEQKVVDAATSGIDLSDNVLYIISSEYIDAYEQQIKNVVMTDDDVPSEAVNAHYVKSLSTALCAKIGEASSTINTRIDNLLSSSEILNLSVHNLTAGNISVDFNNIVDINNLSSINDISTSLYTQLIDLSDIGYATETWVNEHKSKVTINNDSSPADLSIYKVTSDEYADIIHERDVLSNELYVIDDDEFVSVYGRQIKDVENGTSPTDAVNMQQLNAYKTQLVDMLSSAFLSAGITKQTSIDSISYGHAISCIYFLAQSIMQ